MTGPTIDRLRAALADRYRIERELGAGGMATVYLAHDLKHERDVAIKVLHSDLGAALGAERFLSEIKTTARLQHPHILPLLDSGAADGFLFYVMPVVTGEALRARLNRERQLPMAEAVRIAKEVASALDYAHRQGVVHRDIKPENILLHDGQALVADFGIALAVQSAGGARMTQTGLSLGTPQYMSPEQALGERTIDARSDVYALGAVTYEMVTGDPPFTGSSVQAIVARLLNEKPTALHTLRDTVPAAVEQAVLTALAKLPADRFESAKAFGDALVTTGGTAVPASSGPPMSPLVAFASRHGGKIFFALALVVAMIEGVAIFAAKRRDSFSARGEPVAFTVETGGPVVPWGLGITPDGNRLIYGVGDSASLALRVVSRSIGSLKSEPVPGASSVQGVFGITHDSRALIAVRGEGTYLLPLDGSAPTELGPPAWAAVFPDGGIVFARAIGEGLLYRRASGDSARALTVLDSARREAVHWGPVVLPSGNAVLFTAVGTPAFTGVEVVEVSTGKRIRLAGDGAISPLYSTTGHLLFWRRGVLYAAPFDADELKITGPEIAVLEDVAADASGGRAFYHLSDNGTLVYLRQSEFDEFSEVNWIDRAGHERPSTIRASRIVDVTLSPDASRAALVVQGTVPDIWVHDFAREQTVRLTTSPAGALAPVWSRDGRYIYYTQESPTYDLWRVRADGSAPPEAVLVSGEDKVAQALGPDGRLWFRRSTNVTSSELMVMDPASEAEPSMVLSLPAQDVSVRLSADGRWLTYHTPSTFGGRAEVFVARADGLGRQQISNAGGRAPIFVRGDREVLYSTGDSVMSVPFNPATGAAERARLLYRTANDATARFRSVATGGEGMVQVRSIPRPDARPLTVIVNWHTELLRRMEQR